MKALVYFTILASACMEMSTVAANWSGNIEEFHFHVYWFQHNPVQSRQALRLREMIVDNVRARNFTAVCNGVTKKILPNLDEDAVPKFNTGPLGPHPCGSFEVWTPKEYLPQLMSLFMLNRGDLSILLHPLGGPIGMSSYEGHTVHAMWLGPSFRIDLSVLSHTVGDSAQYPSLGLGYSSPRK